MLQGQNTTTERVKEALKRGQAEPAGRTKEHGCPSVPPDDRWRPACSAASPSLTGGKTPCHTKMPGPPAGLQELGKRSSVSPKASK